MRRILFASALAVIAAAISIRALKIADVDTAITLQFGFALALFVLAAAAHVLKRKPE